MNIFDGFKETSDVSDVNKENKSEVSQEAQSKLQSRLKFSSILHTLRILTEPSAIFKVCIY